MSEILAKNFLKHSFQKRSKNHREWGRNYKSRCRCKNTDTLKLKQFNKYMMGGKRIICNYLTNGSSNFSAVFIKTRGLMPEKCHDLSQNLTYSKSIHLEPALNRLKPEF